jgi:hypothetical protein
MLPTKITIEVTFLCTACKWHDPETGTCSGYDQPEIDCSLESETKFLYANYDTTSYTGYVRMATDGTNESRLLQIVKQESSGEE